MAQCAPDAEKNEQGPQKVSQIQSQGDTAGLTNHTHLFVVLRGLRKS